MNTVNTEIEFDAEEEAAIIAELQRLRAEPPPVNPRPYGCLTFVVAAALLLLVPQLPKWFGWNLPQPVVQILFWLLVVALAGGFLIGVFVGSGVYARALHRASESLEWLASHPGLTDPVARRHAVTLIDSVIVSDGPTTSSTIDIDQAKKKLGANLQYVIAVERVLVAENIAYVQFGAV